MEESLAASLPHDTDLSAFWHPTLLPLFVERLVQMQGRKAGLTAIDSFAPTEEAPAYAGLSTGLGSNATLSSISQ